MTFSRIRRAAPAAAAALGICWFVAGAWLRYYQLDLQILVEDEWHALHKILRSGFADIYQSFGRSDHSIPLALYDRWLMLHGGLTEWTMRMPMFASGIALLAVAPLLIRRDADRATRALWVGLLAVSPLLVYFSKIARPYSITVLAVFIAVIAVRRWWRDGGLGSAVAYVAGASTAAWLHPVTLGFTLLPLAYFGVLSLQAVRHDRRPLLRLAGIAAALLLVLAATVGVPLYHDWDAMAAKTGEHAITVDSVYRTGLMLAGTASPVVLLVVAALGAYGAIVLWRRDRELVGFFALLVAGYWALLALSGATWIEHPLVQARYLLIVLPFMLFATATGAIALARRAAWPAAVPIMIVALPLALLALGPLPGSFYYPNQFLGHARFQYDYDEAKNPYVTQAPSETLVRVLRRAGAATAGQRDLDRSAVESGVAIQPVAVLSAAAPAADQSRDGQRRLRRAQLRRISGKRARPAHAPRRPFVRACSPASVTAPITLSCIGRRGRSRPACRQRNGPTSRLAFRLSAHGWARRHTATIVSRCSR